MSTLGKIKFVILCIFSALLVYPPLFIIFSPIYIHRKVVEFFVKKRNPKVARIISGMDALLVGKQDPYLKPMVVLAPYILFKTKLDRAEIGKVLNKQLIDTREFPELTQRIVTKCGYHFWYKVDAVSAEDHVKYLNPECPEKPVTTDDIRSLYHLGHWKQPFDPMRSPWEIILAPNFVNPADPSIKSMIMLRVNHCLMDGIGIMNFWRRAALKPWNVSEDRNQFKEHTFEKLIQFMLLVATGPYHFLDGVFRLKGSSDFISNVATSLKSEAQEMRRKSLSPIYVSLEKLKSLKNLHNVSMTSLLLTVVVEAAVECMSKKVGRVPHVYVGMPLPTYSHPGTMTNHYNSVIIRISEINRDPVKMIKNIHRDLEKTRQSSVPVVGFVVTKVLGLLPVSLIPQLGSLVAHRTIMMSNILGPSEKTDTLGYEYERNGFTGGTCDPAPAFSFMTQSYNGEMRIDSMMAGMLLETEEDETNFNNSILNILKQLEKTNDWAE